MASKKKSSNGQSSKKRQGYLAGTAPPDDVAEIDDAIADYVAAMYKVRELSQILPGLKEAVQQAMLEHKRKTYTYTDGDYEFLCTLDTATEVHFKRSKTTRGKASTDGEAEPESSEAEA